MMKFLICLIALLIVSVSLAQDPTKDKYSPAARRRYSGPPKDEPIPNVSSRLAKRGLNSIWDMMPGSTQDKIDMLNNIVQELSNVVGQCFPDNMVPSDYAKLLCVLFDAVESGKLHDNGPFVTRDNMWSELNDTIFNIYGYGWQLSSDIHLADDFTVPSDYTWFVRQAIAFGYQTGSTTNSTYTHVGYKLWDAIPDTGSILFGNISVNYLSGTSWTGIYRTLLNINNTDRPIMRNELDLVEIKLPEGTYWLEMQADGTLGSGPWMPPITILGTETTGNAVQYYAGNWNNITDNGYQQGLPFEIHGDSIPTQCIYYKPGGEAVLEFSDVFDIVQTYFADKRITQSEYDGFIAYFLGIIAGLGASQESMDAVEQKLHQLDNAVVTGGNGNECSSASRIHSGLLDLI